MTGFAGVIGLDGDVGLEIERISITWPTANGYLDEIPVDRVRAWERGFHEELGAQYADILEGLKTGKELTKEIEEKLIAAIKAFNESFAAQLATTVSA